MFLVLGSLLFCLLNILAFYLYNCYTYWKRRGVLYETPIPPFGNFLGVGRTKHLRDVIGQLYTKFKGKAPFCGAYLFTSKSAVIFDLDLIKNVLIKDFSNFHDRNAFHNVEEDPLTGHLVTLEGEEWRAMRTKLSPVFTSAKMKYMFPTMVAVGENFSQTLKQELNKTPDSVLEIKDLCARFTTDVIGSCAFGIECNSLQDPNAEFRVKGRSIFTESRHSPLVQLFMVTCPDLARKLHMKFFTDNVSNFFINIVKQTVDYRLANNIKRNDFMDLMIELKTKNDDNKHKSHGIDLSEGLTIEQIAAQTFVFFLGGFETSSTTMSFCLYELAKAVEIQEKLRREILATIKECNNEITYEGVKSMAYLEQVIAETLRLYPVLPNLLRKAKNDYQVPNSEHVIEKGITVIIPVSVIHYDAQYYDEPTKFNPDRFLPSEIEKRHSSTYLPFGDGPRNCIGARFGKMQTKLGLISILSHYRVECCSKTEIPIEYDKKNFLVSSKNGIHLKVVPL
uniref:Cytochrome P450 n=1 Tax=Calliphora stygia TaxID=145453 RepID=A0A068F704_CALSG|nr:cytochrome P450 [Calliphora stygia]